MSWPYVTPGGFPGRLPAAGPPDATRAGFPIGSPHRPRVSGVGARVVRFLELANWRGHRVGLPADNVFGTDYRAYVRVRTDEELLAIPGIGPKGLRWLREEFAAMTDPTKPTVDLETEPAAADEADVVVTGEDAAETGRTSPPDEPAEGEATVDGGDDETDDDDGSPS